MNYDEYVGRHSCPCCGRLMYYQVDVAHLGGEWQKVRRLGPSCWNSDCTEYRRGRSQGG